MKGLIVALALVAACKKEQPASGPAGEPPPPQIPASEVKRGQDACGDYVAKVCACTAPAAKDACGLAKALPEAIETGLQVSTNPESARRDVIQANDAVRKTMKECIEQLAKLPSLGC